MVRIAKPHVVRPDWQKVDTTNSGKQETPNSGSGSGSGNGSGK
ncbi:hypothetical protein AB0L00_19860 [Actinoallomurus sp. NPDC052308]